MRVGGNMRPPAHIPVPPLLLLLSCPRGIYRCVQLLLLLLLLLILSGGTARAGRGRRATSVSLDLLPPWLVRQQVSNMSREFNDAWGTCGAKPEVPQRCDGHVHLRHHGRGHCGSLRSDRHVRHICDHHNGKVRAQRLRRLRPPNCGPWTNTSHWGREVAQSTEKCFRTLRHLLHMDELAGAAACRLSHILERYDCHAATTFVGEHLSPHHSMCALCQVGCPALHYHRRAPHYPVVSRPFTALSFPVMPRPMTFDPRPWLGGSLPSLPQSLLPSVTAALSPPSPSLHRLTFTLLLSVPLSLPRPLPSRSVASI